MAEILVIDDEPTVGTTIELLLRSQGHHVVFAASGLEGVQLYAAKPADIVIIDLYMADMDGFETIAELRKLNANIKFIAITGHPVASVLELAEKLGAVVALEKPFELTALFRAVDQALAA
jgi:CheY-like chemotaxis protein